MKVTRRTVLKLGIPGLLAGLGGMGYGFGVEPHRLSLERVRMPVADLPEALEGLRIAVLSDFHLHPFTKIEHIQAAVELANGLRPDLTVLLGDFVDETVEAIHELAPALAKLNARLGIFGVLGNHDHWEGPQVVAKALQDHGISMLLNAGIPLSVGSSELFLAGVQSAWAGHPDLRRALDKRRGESPVVLLAHEPDFANRAAADGRIALQLSGHSHGGQVRLPGIGALELPSWGRRYDHGNYRIGKMQLYTNRGIGVVDIPVRFNCPPEVTEVTLVRA